MEDLSVIFKVPIGLESISFDEINDKFNTLKYEFSVETYSGHVKVTLQNLSGVDKVECWRLINQLNFYSIEKRYLFIDEIIFDKSVFQFTCPYEKNEFQDKLPVKLQYPTFWIQWLIYQSVYTINWDTHLPLLDINPTEPNKFRIDFDRNDFYLKNCKSLLMGGAIGAGFLVNHKSQFKVDLTEFKFEFFADLLPVENQKDKMRLLVGARDTALSGHDDLIYLRSRKFHGRTSLRPTIAYCISRLASIQPGDVVLDLCCGVGTLSIEASNNLQPNAYYLGGDIEDNNIFNLAYNNLINSKPKWVDISCWDSKLVPLRDSCVDWIISDLPWGVREGNFRMVQRLYPQLIKQIIRVLRSGGRALLMTLEIKLIEIIFTHPWFINQMKILNQWNLKVGYKVKLYLLEKL